MGSAPGLAPALGLGRLKADSCKTDDRRVRVRHLVGIQLAGLRLKPLLRVGERRLGLEVARSYCLAARYLRTGSTRSIRCAGCLLFGE